MTANYLTWAEAVAAAPELTSAIAQRFAQHKHHIIGTIRADRSPRLSGSEVQFSDSRVTVGMMPNSRKLADLEHDRRVEVHCAPLDTELNLGDAKLSGELVLLSELTEPAGYEFELRISRMSLVTVEADDLVIKMWSPENGTRQVRRK
jgi:hypothetical protein